MNLSIKSYNSNFDSTEFNIDITSSTNADSTGIDINDSSNSSMFQENVNDKTIRVNKNFFDPST